MIKSEKHMRDRTIEGISKPKTRKVMQDRDSKLLDYG